MQAKSDEYYTQLASSIDNALDKNNITEAENLLSTNPDFLTTQKDHANKLIARHSKDINCLKLLLNYGADANYTDNKGVTVLEEVIETSYLPKPEKQEIVDTLIRYRADLNRPYQKTPTGKSAMSILSNLPFFNLKVTNNKHYDALKLQKYLAMFLEIPGESKSNGTVCKHGYMRDVHAYSNYIIDLYVKHLADKQVNLPPDFNQTLKAIYSDNGAYDAKELYRNYELGTPVISPVYITDGWGGAHVACFGILKLNYAHIIVKADRGFGAHYYSATMDNRMNYYDFEKYLRSNDAPIYTWKWQNSNFRPLLEIDIGAQQDDFCPSIATKYALNIAYLLSHINHALADQDRSKMEKDSLEIEKIIKSSYEATDEWYKQLCTDIQEIMLTEYLNLDAQYIDNAFLEQALKTSGSSQLKK